MVRFLIIAIGMFPFLFQQNTFAQQNYSLESWCSYQKCTDNKPEWNFVQTAQLVPLKNTFLIVYPIQGGMVELSMLMEHYAFDPEKIAKRRSYHPYTMMVNRIDQSYFSDEGHFYFVGHQYDTEIKEYDPKDDEARMDLFGDRGDYDILEVRHEDSNGVQINIFEFDFDFPQKSGYTLTPFSKQMTFKKTVEKICANDSFLILYTSAALMPDNPIEMQNIQQCLLVFQRKGQKCQADLDQADGAEYSQDGNHGTGALFAH